MTSARFAERGRHAGGLIAVFAIVLGARLWLIECTGSEVPILDQWDEGAFLLKRFVEGSLRVADLFAPHNEHRIVLTRLWSLLWFVLNGQWDPFLEIVVNAVLVAGLAVLFAFGATRLVRETYRGYVLAAVTLWAALPYAQENTIWGFQSQFYFLLLFSLTGLWMLIGWQGGWLALATAGAAALISCFTMASGFFCAFAVLFVIFLRVVTKRATLPDVAIVSTVAVAVAITGWISRAPAVQHHAGFAAPSFGSWAALFARCLAWPFSQWAIIAIVSYAPLLLLCAAYLKRARSCDARKTEVMLGLGMWVILQAAAIAYGRAGHEPRVVSRYMDILAAGAIANFLALLMLLETRSRYSRAFAGAWTTLVVLGAAWASIAQVRYESGRRPYMDNAAMVARAFLATHDAALLRSSPLAPIPHPNPDHIAALLNDPTIQRILPCAIRPPLRLEPATSDATFARDALPPQIVNKSHERVWGSYSAEGVRATGSFRSTPVPSHLPYLELEIAGYLRSGLSLDVDDVRTGKQHRVIPTQPIDNQWRAAYVAVPQGAHLVTAEDSRDDQWFAFREPRECGRLSYFALRAARWGVTLITSGALLFLLLLVWKAAAQQSRATVTRAEQAHETR